MKRFEKFSTQQRVKAAILIGVLLVFVVLALLRDGDGVPIARNVSGVPVASTTPAMLNSAKSGSTASVPRVGEGPDTTVKPGEPPNAAENPLVIGIEPCKLFKLEEVQAKFTKQIVSTRQTGGGTGCDYSMSASSGSDGFLLAVSRGDTPEKFATTKKDVQAATEHFETLNNVGDEAFVYWTSSDGLTDAEARKGALRVRALVRGDGTAHEQAIYFVTEAVKRLP